VVKVPIEESAAARARWLAELADALDDAQKLMWNLGEGAFQSPETMELYVRIETARLEIRSLRLSRRAPDQPLSDPKWIELPWERTAGGRAN
jgi:hypothetical protein